MAGKKHFNDLAKRLKKLGYVATDERTNHWNNVVFAAADGHKVNAAPNIHEHAARALLRSVEERRGAVARVPKRNVQAFKRRQSAEREQLRAENERLERARLRILSDRDALLDGAGSHLTDAEIRDLERRVREIEERQREISALMTERPKTGREHAKHRSGER